MAGFDEMMKWLGGINKAAEELGDETEKEIASLPKFNLMVFGKTGAGKSTLLNAIFGDNFAETGGGVFPVTQEITKYSSSHLTIYDTPGLEIGTATNSMSDLIERFKKFIDENQNKGAEESIHEILYCINCGTSRIEEGEIEFIRSIQKCVKVYNIPVIAVLTRADNKETPKNLKRTIEEKDLPFDSVVPVLAKKYENLSGGSVEAYGLKELVLAITNNLDRIKNEDIKKTLAVLQKVSVELKIKEARKIVNSSSVKAGTIGLSPIPFSDAFLLVPLQMRMFAKINAVFGYDLSRDMLMKLVTPFAGAQLAKWIGQWTARGILKLTPVGYAASAAVSASVATAITKGMGEAYISLLTMVSEGKLNFSDFDTVVTTFTSLLSNNFDSEMDQLKDSNKEPGESKDQKKE